MSVRARVWGRDKTGRLKETRKPLGSKQVETLISFKDGSLFEPARYGKPWPVMERLIDLGLMYAKREKVSSWEPDGRGWSEDRWQWRAGLTPWGHEYLSAMMEARK